MATDPTRFEDRLPPGWLERDETKRRVLDILSTRSTSRRKRNRRLVTGGAAIVAALALSVAVFRPSGKSTPVVTPIATRSTPLQSSLPDGSRIEYKSGSIYTVDYTDERRHIVLLRGTAHFDVAKNADRPFVVTAGGVAIRAVGTAFSVGHQDDEIEVLVTEGQVAVAASDPERPAAPASLHAGEGVRLSTSQLSATDTPRFHRISPAMFEEKLAWRATLVELSGTPLREAMRILNEHNRVQFTVADDSLNELKLSGVIRADRVAGVVKFLQGEGITVEARSDREFVLRRAGND